jgi:hypothetical protein
MTGAPPFLQQLAVSGRTAHERIADAKAIVDDEQAAVGTNLWVLHLHSRLSNSTTPSLAAGPVNRLNLVNNAKECANCVFLSPPPPKHTHTHCTHLWVLHLHASLGCSTAAPLAAGPVNQWVVQEGLSTRHEGRPVVTQHLSKGNTAKTRCNLRFCLTSKHCPCKCCDTAAFAALRFSLVISNSDRHLISMPDDLTASAEEIGLPAGSSRLRV